MFEERVLELLRKYLGDYVAGLDREALRISVWKGEGRMGDTTVVTPLVRCGALASWERVPPVVAIAACAVGTHRAVSHHTTVHPSL